MTEEENLYRQMHRTKIKIAISASLLIGSAFLAIFMGAYKIEWGLSDQDYLNYRNFPVPVPARGIQPFQVLAYNGRTLATYKDGELYGTNHLASVIHFDMATGNGVVNFSAPDPSMNVGYVENVNEWYDGNENTPLVLVQFADVETAMTKYIPSGGDVDYYTFHNDTGTYRAYIWNLTAPDTGIGITEITAAIGAGSRVIGNIRLPYNPSDSLADFIVISTNRTWQKQYMQLGLAGEGVLYGMHAIRANGSLAWATYSNQSGSLIEMSSTMVWPEITKSSDQGIESTGFAINSTHFAVELPDNKVAVGEIATGSLTWKVSDVQILLGFPRDQSGDGCADVACVTTSHIAVCLNGRNGSTLPSPTIALGMVEVKSMHASSRFGNAYDLFMTKDDPNKKMRFYRYNETGFSLEWEVDFNGYNLNSWSFAWRHYFDYSGRAVLGVRLGLVSGRSDEYRLYDITRGAVITTARGFDESAFFGDFIASWDGMELVVVSTSGGYKIQAIELGSTVMFELDPINAIVFVASMIVGLISGLALIMAKRVHSRLSRKEEELQPALASREHSIRTTAATTRPLRTLSTAMLLVLVASTVLFVVYIIVIGTGDTYFESANFYAVRNGYITISLTLVSLPMIAVLNNHVSPKSAMLYIKIQRFFYQKLFRGKKEYRVVVLDMSEYSKKFSISLVISRSLFPLLVSLTLGLTVFGAFASDTTGMGGTTGSINLVWLSEFELYAGLTFIGSYLLMMLISPGGWLLDDSGVVYFEQPVDTHHPGDISKISDWLTGWLKGFFGFTAIINYYQLFAGTDFTSLVNMDDPLMAIVLIVFVFIIMIILSPILYGLIAMFSSNASMIDDLEYNRKILYDNLQKAGIDVAPKRLKDFFDRT
jgi:hypothetical protein